MTTKITLGYWRTRDGSKVRVICVDAPGERPVIVVGCKGGLYTHCSDGRYHTDGSYGALDLIAPWADPPKVRECWGLFTERGMYSSYNSKEAAEMAANSAVWVAPPTIHHLREVNPAREKAAEKLVEVAKNAASVLGGASNSILPGSYQAYRNVTAALAELDKAGGL